MSNITSSATEHSRFLSENACVCNSVLIVFVVMYARALLSSIDLVELILIL